MTINELEQGLRNLMASQQAILSSPIGTEIRGLLNVTESYREFMFRLQTYPAQDMFLTQVSSRAKQFENEITSFATSTLQEKGINLLLYVPQNSFGNIGQTAFSNPLMPNDSMTSAVKVAYNNSNVNVNNNVEANLVQKPTGKPTFASGNTFKGDSEIESSEENYSKITKRRPTETSTEDKIVEEKADESNDSETQENTSGRDYLLELLKK